MSKPWKNKLYFYYCKADLADPLKVKGKDGRRSFVKITGVSFFFSSPTATSIKTISTRLVFRCRGISSFIFYQLRSRYSKCNLHKNHHVSPFGGRSVGRLVCHDLPNRYRIRDALQIKMPNLFSFRIACFSMV